MAIGGTIIEQNNIGIQLHNYNYRFMYYATRFSNVNVKQYV